MNDRERRDADARMQAERVAVVAASRELVQSSRLLRTEAARLVAPVDPEGERGSPTEAALPSDDEPPLPPPVDSKLDDARKELHAAVDAVADGAAKIKKHLGRSRTRS